MSQKKGKWPSKLRATIKVSFPGALENGFCAQKENVQLVELFKLILIY